MELSGWIGNILFLIGAILIAKRHVGGLVCNFFANGAYLVQSYITYNRPLFVLSVILMLVNAIGVINWRQYDSRH